MPFIRPIVAMLTAATLMMAAGGCRQAAVSEVVMLSAKYEEHLSTSDARVSIESIDRYLASIAEEIREAASAIHEEDKEAARLAGEMTREPEVNLHDEFNIYLVHSTSPNAATPGDNCANITSRMFLELETPQQLYAILGHEFGHISEMHQVEQVERRLTTEITVAVVAGIGAGLEAGAAARNPYYQRTDWSGFMRTAMAAYVPWRKEDEFEADLYGMRICSRLGIGSDDFISLFELFRDRWGDPDSDSHPRNSERIARLQTAAEEMALPQQSEHFNLQTLRQHQRQLAMTLERLESQGELAEEELQLAARVSSGALSSKICACGPLHLDDNSCNAGFKRIQSRRK